MSDGLPHEVITMWKMAGEDVLEIMRQAGNYTTVF